MSSRDRSRTPTTREGESEIQTILRMMDRISELKAQMAEKVSLISELRSTVMDKKETIAELKVQLAESRQKHCSLWPACALPDVTRAALQVVCKQDDIETVVELRGRIEAMRRSFIKRQEELQQQKEQLTMLQHDYPHMARILNEQGFEWR